jgi:mannose-1-phosphate guanylyltransferase/mannose-1-phosphate guanylyltransferase/mannose-6-phosphate isomerase
MNNDVNNNQQKKYLKPYIETRPWGNFEQFTKNESSTVKIITVNPGGELSLQYHAKRSEFWKVLSGQPTITIDDAVVTAHAGDEFFAPAGAKHRIQAGDTPAAILEVAFGDFDENDITRLEDKYGRA